MLLQWNSRMLLFLSAAVILLIIGWSTRSNSWPAEKLADLGKNLPFNTSPWQSTPAPTPEETIPEESTPAEPTLEEHTPLNALWDPNTYVVLKSTRLTPDKKWFHIYFGEQGSYNPNIIPHPWKHETWYMIAQGAQTTGDILAATYNKELVCEAAFVNNQMQCVKPQTSLPIASSVSDRCGGGDYDLSKLMIGPVDARVFYGPDRPYIIWGSASQYTCFGLWIQDLRRLTNWDEFVYPEERFFWPTELQRPPPYGKLEKNWFPFWDQTGDMYLHYDITPRSFSKVSDDGKSVSANLASAEDDVCIQKYKPQISQHAESIHQATNSLAVTMCRRSDPDCEQTADNMFVFSIFHHKQYHGHNLYEPYVFMFRQQAPFQMHAIASKPFWINGRGKPGDGNPNRPADQSEMMYITSISWQSENLTYNGFLDDELFINFGIDDEIAGSIDVLAEDLLQEMHLCSGGSGRAEVE